MLAVVLTVLTACKSVEYIPVDAGETYTGAIVDILPVLPTLPDFPELKWEYSGGRYSISEADVDTLLDYKDNVLVLYRYELGVYKDEMLILVNALKKDYN